METYHSVIFGCILSYLFVKDSLIIYFLTDLYQIRCMLSYLFVKYLLIIYFFNYSLLNWCILSIYL
jgi:hypothetical protein